MITKITVDTIEEKKKKDGSPIEGEKNGRKWKLFKINGMYDFFSGEECKLEIGEEYEMEVESKTNEYGTTTMINFPRKGGFAKPEAQNGSLLVMEELISFRKEVNERLDSMGEYLAKNLKKE